MSKKLLVVDDEKDILEILKAILEHAGYNVITAEDGEDGVQKAKQEKPDLIVTDVMMPRLDGYGLVEKIKADPETSYIPIIMLTAKDQAVDRYKGLSLGVAAYIVKLFDLDELTDTVNDVLTNCK